MRRGQMRAGRYSGFAKLCMAIGVIVAFMGVG